MSSNGPRFTKFERSNSDTAKPIASLPKPSKAIPIDATPSLLTRFESMRPHSAPVSVVEGASFVVGSPFGSERRKVRLKITQSLEAKAMADAEAKAEAEAPKEDLVAEKSAEDDDESNSNDDICGVFSLKL